MKLRSAAAVCAVIIASASVSACGGSGLPRTSANVAICAALAKLLQSRPTVPELAGLAFESNRPVTRQLGHDIGAYVMLAVHRPASGQVRRAAATAESDCASIHAAVAPGYGGSG
jgi:ribosomal protein S12 methylthiotransferase accessory factor YcaO